MPHTCHKYPCSKKAARKEFLKISKSRKGTRKKTRIAIGKQLKYVEAGLRQVERFRQLAPDVELPGWLENRLEVIPTFYEQQKMMYDTHTHQCPDRVVSLHEPHVNPIWRGKRNAETEFGQKLHLSDVDGLVFLEQTSWSNFNEGNDLPAVVEACYRRFGFYPEAVLADQIYRTRANLAYCKEHGIRLSGKPMGRRKKDPKENAKVRRQTYKDSCDRNGIEGDNGTLKTRYEMDCVMSRLPGTSETEVPFDILAMNAETLYRRDRAKAEGKTKARLRARPGLKPLPEPGRIHRHAGSLC